MSSTGGYRSPVNLSLSRVPITTDPEQFGELTDVYNSIHMISAQLDKIRLSIEGGGEGQTPAQSAPFTRFFPAVALQTIVAGNVISPVTTPGLNGVINGALGHLLSSTTPERNFAGIALTSAEIGETVRVGIGPGVLTVPGAISGNLIWAYCGTCSNGVLAGVGGLYLTNPGALAVTGGTVYPTVVGVCIADDFVLFDQFVRRNA